jgi:hypothetical protein
MFVLHKGKSSRSAAQAKHAIRIARAATSFRNCCSGSGGIILLIRGLYPVLAYPKGQKMKTLAVLVLLCSTFQAVRVEGLEFGQGEQAVLAYQRVVEMDFAAAEVGTLNTDHIPMHL